MSDLWGRKSTEASRLRKRGNRFYQTFLWTLPVLLLLFIDQLTVAQSDTLPLWLTAMMMWAAWALIGLIIIGGLDLYESVPSTTRIAVFVWSAASVSLADWLNGIIIPGLVFDANLAIARTPFVEEGLKLISVLLVVGISPSLTKRPLPLIICGLLSGLGFAFIENALKSIAPIKQANALLQLNGRYEEYHPILDSFAYIIERGFLSTPWLHSTLAAISCVGVYYFVKLKQFSLPMRALIALIFYLLACAGHALNNWISVSQFESIIGNLFAPLYQAASLLVCAMVVLWAMRHEQAWFVSATDSADPYITHGESKRLITRRLRMQDRVGTSRHDGRYGVKLFAKRQKLQLAYVNCIDEAGLESDDCLKLRQEIESTAKKLKLT